ncbi:type II toxin-antitoxin system PemK/MazF family toxin [Candidatus Glomeribacter gigasporarum]|uniref:type II toxin-antitoxin system PemK/MazF family toxin n=1 Tax=Candidatus Glomeribacter gigasporarum TaxID=132144 RepID=UPI002A4E2CF7|nr:type II toxin-antitoxin system PemK/MazF family toxin [Candidatus Glomeribacter gigasporarum]
MESVSILPLTSYLEDAPVFRVVIEPTGGNGVSKLSQTMVDKMMPVRKERIREMIGALESYEFFNPVLQKVPNNCPSIDQISMMIA